MINMKETNISKQGAGFQYVKHVIYFINQSSSSSSLPSSSSSLSKPRLMRDTLQLHTDSNNPGSSTNLWLALVAAWRRAVLIFQSDPHARGLSCRNTTHFWLSGPTLPEPWFLQDD